MFMYLAHVTRNMIPYKNQKPQEQKWKRCFDYGLHSILSISLQSMRLTKALNLSYPWPM